MKIFGSILSLLCIVAMATIGFGEYSRAQASQLEQAEALSAQLAENERVIAEMEARRALAEIGTVELECLAKNIFWEARNQSVAGRVAVAWVTLNRVDSDRYPSTICGVVQQANRDSEGNVITNQCQFSWYCDGKSDRIPQGAIPQRAWENAQLIAEVVLLDRARGHGSLVADATMYHANYVNPYWTSSYEAVVEIDDHIFYR